MRSGLFMTAPAARSAHLNGGGKAAEGATLSALEARGLNEIPLRGIVPATLAVPGGVASWIEAHDACGRLPLRRVLESAIGYARDGFPVTGRLASFIAMMRDDLVQRSGRRRAFLSRWGGSAAGRETNQRKPGAHAAIDRG